AIRQVNRAVIRPGSDKFVTMFYAEIDATRGALRYTNAGHNYPLVRRADGSIVDLTTGGLPLGLIDDAAYEQGECAFAPGDALLLYSDGVTEAFDAQQREFGDERLRSLWTGLGAGPCAAVIDGVFSAVEAFRGHALQSDDMTIVVVG